MVGQLGELGELGRGSAIYLVPVGSFDWRTE